MSHSVNDENVAGAGYVQEPHTEEPSIGELLSGLSENFSTLVRQEMELAKAELKETGKNAGTGAGLFGGAGVSAVLSLLFLSLALWWFIAVWIGDAIEPALGWSGLIMAVLWAIAAAIMASIGKKAIDKAPGLERTTETLSKIPDAVKGNEENNR